MDDGFDTNWLDSLNKDDNEIAHDDDDLNYTKILQNHYGTQDDLWGVQFADSLDQQDQLPQDDSLELFNTKGTRTVYPITELVVDTSKLVPMYDAAVKLAESYKRNIYDVHSWDYNFDKLMESTKITDNPWDLMVRKKVDITSQYSTKFCEADVMESTVFTELVNDVQKQVEYVSSVLNKKVVTVLTQPHGRNAKPCLGQMVAHPELADKYFDVIVKRGKSEKITRATFLTGKSTARHFDFDLYDVLSRNLGLKTINVSNFKIQDKLEKAGLRNAHFITDIEQQSDLFIYSSWTPDIAPCLDNSKFGYGLVVKTRALNTATPNVDKSVQFTVAVSNTPNKITLKRYIYPTPLMVSRHHAQILGKTPLPVLFPQYTVKTNDFKIGKIRVPKGTTLTNGYTKYFYVIKSQAVNSQIGMTYPYKQDIVKNAMPTQPLDLATCHPRMSDGNQTWGTFSYMEGDDVALHHVSSDAGAIRIVTRWKHFKSRFICTYSGPDFSFIMVSIKRSFNDLKTFLNPYIIASDSGAWPPGPTKHSYNCLNLFCHVGGFSFSPVVTNQDLGWVFVNDIPTVPMTENGNICSPFMRRGGKENYNLVVLPPMKSSAWRSFIKLPDMQYECAPHTSTPYSRPDAPRRKLCPNMIPVPRKL